MNFLVLVAGEMNCKEGKVYRILDIKSDHQVPENPSVCVNCVILLLIQFPPLNVRSGGRTLDLHNT